MRVLYIDTLFLINFIMNYFLLLATAKICAVSSRRRRLAAAAALGALYAALAVLPGLAFLTHPAAKLAIGAAMLLTAFGPARRFARLALVFFAVSAAAAGAVMAAGLLGGGSILARIDLRILVVSFIACYAVLTLVFRRVSRVSARYAALTLTLGGEVLTLRALIDTGNSLRDPVSGDPVAVVAAADLLPLFPKETRPLARDALRGDAAPAIERLSAAAIHFRLVPYAAVGGGGLLPAFRPDAALVDGTPRALLVAVSPTDLSDNGAYNAILPGDHQ